MTEKVLNEKSIYDGKIIRVHVDDVELADGKKSIREIVEHSGGVCVAALTDKDELFFVRQFRSPFKRELMELPAGKLEKGEIPLDAGLRELEEECGVIADKVIDMGRIFPTVAYCSEIIYLFAATGLHSVNQHLDDGEFLSVEKIPLQKAVEMVMSGELCDAKTVALVLKIAKLKEEGKL